MNAPRRDAATERQIEAADPRSCTWLSANAGSGKTRVLTDRVARLLLADAPPQNILCLTYTKAAASEMQNRLFKRLGSWAMLPDAQLARALAELGADDQAGPETLRKARRLFARAIETPGGLKIQTIHSFCAALLRRFPLEAGLTPGFTEMDESAQVQLQSEALSRVLKAAPDTFLAFAAQVSDTDMTRICGEIARHRGRFPNSVDPDAIHHLLELPPGYRHADALTSVLDGLDRSDLVEIADELAGLTPTMVELSQELRIAATQGLDEALYASLLKRTLYAESGPKAGHPKPSAITKKAREALGVLAEDFEALQNRLAIARDERKAIAAAQQTVILHQFATAFLPQIDAIKMERGWLDFDDLIDRAEALLGRSGVADWVLYRLEGGIDHILVDEAQDTSPGQWRVIEHLTREMTAGEGTRATGEKTLFVVGDLKQSIYSFQGADPEAFGLMRDTFQTRLAAPGPGLQRLDLEFSFRSAAPILETVDATFEGENRRGLGDAFRHLAFQKEMPGRVDLWPVIEPSEKADSGPWSDPIDHVAEDHHTVRMARRVSEEIRRIIDEEVLWDKDGGHYRPRRITCGDFLILVQGRQALFHEIIAACKGAGLDVAGADVLPLGEELAFKDLVALLSFLALPEDNLSLAAALRSPLFGWSEADLYDLAAGRGDAFLWQALRGRAEEFPETYARLRSLRDETDFRRPYELLERILIGHRGRARLIGRLGDEASDGIDALLGQALAYETTEAPSLTGFLAAMEAADITVKRRAEGRGDKIRVMTVHGSKGLESPIVLLPDCGRKISRGQVKDRILPSDSGAPIWRPDRADVPSIIERKKDEMAEAQLEEAQRLLYVAMTRAEQWLIVGAAGDLGRDGATWWDRIDAGLQRMDASEHLFGFGHGHRLESDSWDTRAQPPDGAAPATDQTQVPGWADQSPVRPAEPPGWLTASRLGGAKALPGDSALPEDEAKARGTRLHLLLEHLPGASDRAGLAARLLGGAPDCDALLAEAETVLAAPDLAPIFVPGALAEVEIVAPAGTISALPMRGIVDRLLIAPDHVLAVDYKSNAIVPDSAQDVPEGLLRQMGAYRAMLELLYPDRRIETALLWTRTATLMPLPDTLIQAALLRARHEGVIIPPS